jgi:two-component system, LytTR family, sensor kinase
MRKFSIPLLHVGYWLMYSLLLLVLYLFLALSGLQHNQDPQVIFVSWLKIIVGFAYVPGIIGFYFGYCIAFPKYLAQRQIKALVGKSIVASFVAALFGGLALSFIFRYNILWNDGLQSAIPQLILMSFIGAINLVLGSVIRGFVQSTIDISIKESLERERMQLEMYILRIQVNPHFLFNTLNNIDALIKVDPIKASEYLHKLSHFMRQLVYQIEDPLQPLDREIMLIDDYIELQQLRSEYPIEVQWSLDGPTDDVHVPPMLLLPLIENCFKHGLLNNDHPLIIRIATHHQHVEIAFRNAIDPSISRLPGGLGLDLTRKRLSAMYGHGAQLFTGPTADGYLQQISIPSSL